MLYRTSSVGQGLKHIYQKDLNLRASSKAYEEEITDLGLQAKTHTFVLLCSVPSEGAGAPGLMASDLEKPS